MSFHYPKISKRTCILLASVVSLLVVLSLIVAALNSPSRYALERAKEGTPQYALKLLFDAEFEDSEALCTQGGYELLLGLRRYNRSTSTPQHDYEYQAPILSKRVCDLPATAFDLEGETRIVYRMVYRDGAWKFHDVYYDTSNGSNLGVWGSDFVKNPSLTIAKSLWKDMKRSSLFLKPILDIAAAIAR